MLPPIFTERFDQLMRGKFEELAPQAQTEFARRSAELAARGQGSPSNLPALRHENTVWLLTRWIQAALEAIIRLSSLYNIPHSETLASDLKALLEACASETWCRRMVDNYFTHDDQQRNSYNWELLQERRIALNRANTEIDLLVDGIRTRTQATTVQAKELEQKFGILLSAKQAQIDFEIWAGELMSSSRSIAILFVDIDNFKPLNTRYTETIIDETVLPDVMKLIQNFIRFRGGAYRHGGEEFLVILPNSDSSEASAFAEKLRAAFESTDFKVKEQVERLTISIGIALWPQHGSTYDEVLKMANEAESEAKGTKNACVVTKK